MVKKLTLPNGLRIILVPEASSLAATVLVLVEAGSEYETKKINGISHFLEHMCFKGTTKRPSAGVISSELDSLGAEYNAFTAQEYTGYWAKAQAHKLPHILEIVSDLYANPVFDPKEIEKERGVVIEEINMYEDTPMRRVEELFMQLTYGDQPAGWDIAGRKEVVRRLTRDDFLAYRAKRYLAPATVVIVAGAFRPKDVIPNIKNHFAGLLRRRPAPKPKTRERQSAPRTLVKFKESDQSHFVLGARAFDLFDKRRYALQVLADVAGGGMSSRLFHRVREEMGAAYYVRATPELFADHGYFAVASGVDVKRGTDVVHAVLDELQRLAREPVGASELRKTKDHMIGRLILQLETSDEQASFYGGQEIMTRTIVSPEELIRRVERVRAEDVRNLARFLFRDDRLNLAVIGPYKNPAPFRKALRFG